MRVIYDKTKDNTVVSINSPTVLETVDNTDILINKEDVTSVLHTGITGPAGADGPISGITEASELLVYIGRTAGAGATTTQVYNDIIFEQFGLNDELYMTWQVPDDIKRDVAQHFHGHLFTINSGSNRTTSWEVNITAMINQNIEKQGQLLITDVPIPDTANTHSHADVDFPIGDWVSANTTSLHIRLKRVSSANDPVVGIGVTVLHMVYTSDGRVGEQGLDGAPGGEDEVAQAKRVDFIDSETLYRGEAVPGSADSAAVWRIRKITISAVDGDVIEKWADGTADYVKVWNSHLTYTYI